MMILYKTTKKYASKFYKEQFIKLGTFLLLHPIYKKSRNFEIPAFYHSNMLSTSSYFESRSSSSSM